MKMALQTLRQGAQTLRKKLSRRWLHFKMRGRPEAEILAEERKLRGVEQYDKLRNADIVVVSFGKSGRTWLRVMISHLFRVKHGLPDNAILSFDNFHNLAPGVPKIFFTHDNYIKDFTGDFETKQPFYDKRVVLLARDPRDVAVSQFFQWKFRIKPSKVAINNYPPRGSEISLFDFVTGDNGGSMHAVADYLNLWARESGKVRDFHLLRYEDLRAHTRDKLVELLAFMQVEASDAEIDAAVEYSSYENMKKMESQSTFRLAGGRMMPRDKDNPDSYKVRRAKVGGYRDYFTDEEVERIDRQLAETLDPLYDYR
ncbi:sulfotransferase [Mangrovimicrobium sediminis]|uniref:Sulfotransferase n=1 Tax=Mangrovimicrobium sediminis TaxID=2562682 RepID=A0A4Z0LWD4_9GAMM|nr:sulfotransferase domain-containing protein [Haliea sp. SAOS-164]TGD71591.1 sulfotransferase [Haliea sp. SAOS-164]